MSRSSNESLLTPSVSEDDDFEMVCGDLPIRNKAPSYEDDVRIQVHSSASAGSFLLSCQPPHQPKDDIKHTPCDIVLVIDVSGSMNASAPLPDTGDSNPEDNGLSVLDLVKHSSRTILENLDSNDRLGIVTFSDDAKIIQDLTPMTEKSKKETQRRIANLRDDGITNLWSGIRTGLKLFENVPSTNNVQGLYILTDGMPNHMCPKQGYVNKLKPMLDTMSKAKAEAGATMPTIHTFGFGYSIRSDLMQSIADIGNGNYAFIPDAGMIGTVFVHAVANLFSTFAVNATLDIEAPLDMDIFCPAVFNVETVSNKRTRFHLGNLLYGQSRDLCFSHSKNRPDITRLKATLTYKDRFGRQYSTYASPSALTYTPSGQFLAYHIFRSQLCKHLAAFSPVSAGTNEHTSLKVDDSRFATASLSIQKLVTDISSSPHARDPKVASLIQDLTAQEGESHGQIQKALLAEGNTQYYQKWGRHYIPSLLHAHARQVCNSFKDPGPLMYGTDSPMFVKCKSELDQAFDDLPAPTPSIQPARTKGKGMTGATNASRAPIRMARYHCSSNPCFAGACPVTMADHSIIPISKLKRGASVHTPLGPRKVAAIVRTDPPAATLYRGQICRIDDLWVTPWHPCYIEGKWTFPVRVAQISKQCDEPVYSVLLEKDDDPEAHVITVAGIKCVTLGHGKVVSNGSEEDDVRAHAFFGDWEKVAMCLRGFWESGNEHLRCAGVIRDTDSGLVSWLLRREQEPCTDDVEQVAWVRNSLPLGKVPKLVERVRARL